jgi:broad specificity phosphatase PhoE
VIIANFPDYFISPDFSEEDTLWRSDRFETPEEHAARKQQVLEDIFDHDSNQFIHLTTHSYAISAILDVLGMKTFRVREGSSIAILVKAEKIPSGETRPRYI